MQHNGKETADKLVIDYQNKKIYNVFRVLEDKEDADYGIEYRSCPECI